MRLVVMGRRIEVSVAHEKAHDPLFVFALERYIEWTLVDGFGDQLVRVADHIGLHLAQSNARVRQRASGVPLVKKVRPVSLVDEHLERNTELFAVVQNRRMRVRNAPWTDVHVLSVVKGTDLAFTVDLGVFRALTHRPTQPADAVASFE